MERLVEKRRALLGGGAWKQELLRDLQLAFAAFVGLALLIIFLGLTGCTRRTNSPLSGPIKGPAAEKGASFQAMVTTLPSPHPCRVRLRWSASPSMERFFLHRKSEGDFFQQTQLASLKGTDSEFTDSKVEEGKTYLYFLGVLKPEGYRVIGRTKVTIPTTEIREAR